MRRLLAPTFAPCRKVQNGAERGLFIILPFRLPRALSRTLWELVSDPRGDIQHRRRTRIKEKPRHTRTGPILPLASQGIGNHQR